MVITRETWFRLIGGNGGEIGIVRLENGEWRFEPEIFPRQNFTAEALREIASVVDQKSADHIKVSAEPTDKQQPKFVIKPWLDCKHFRSNRCVKSRCKTGCKDYFRLDIQTFGERYTKGKNGKRKTP